MTFALDMYQTVALAVLVPFLGQIIIRFIPALNRFCIPAPVVGGLVVSAIALIGYVTNSFFFEFTTTLQTPIMMFFFAAVGFSFDFKALFRYGARAIGLSVLLIMIVIVQNVVCIGWANVFDIHPLLAISAGSASMLGGHGTAGGFTPLFEAAGATGAVAAGMAAATFGLIAGGLLGGPVSRFLISRHKLSAENVTQIAVEETAESEEVLTANNLAYATTQIFLTIGIATVVAMIFAKTPIALPVHICAMLVAAVLRNVSDATGLWKTPLTEILSLSQVSLTIYVAMAIMTLKLWELSALALPLTAILLTQVAVLGLLTAFVGYYISGKDYDSAVMMSGACGLGLGAAPNAFTNMQTVTQKYGASPISFVILTTVAFFAGDLVNSVVLSALLTYFS